MTIIAESTENTAAACNEKFICSELITNERLYLIGKRLGRDPQELHYNLFYY